ncbi:MAG: cytochrome c oxidase subunit 3 [Flavobacteriaceae bacterium]|nr:cytochrome c oxidase subunit 3 [Flavobacteriaceae bacterium]MDG1064501.1 cytochrome c oxidase subunit 3 [Flavobacteriaceae bacterium]MDG1961416.1 cytochrome c oxidase subunit 3 [Flavobacteriaceae bacterium]
MNTAVMNEFEQKSRAKKMLLWFSMVSLGMSFAGLTSAYVVSKERADWLENLQIPSAFFVSLILILVSSLTMEWAKRSIKQGANQIGMWALLTTWLLGVGFVATQYFGFSQIYNDFGFAFTGPTSSIAYTFIFLIAVVHLAHIFGALIALTVVIYNHFKQRYTPTNTLGLELAILFWHFVDVLWIYLFLFFYFVR